MNETNVPETHHSEGHGGTGTNVYLVIFIALAVFTIISFVVNAGVRHDTLTPHTGFTLILAVAVCKAVLVGMFFMHLKFDWGRLYFLIIPALILGTLLVVVLLPDIVIAWHHPAIR